MDLFAKTQDLFLRLPTTNANMDKGYWYWIYFRCKIPHYNVPLPTSSSLSTQNDILHAFGKRICYLLIAVDELGKLHYLKSEDEIMMLYHFNYLLSLITGIFDSLAIHTIEKYGIRFPSDNIPSRVTLKNNGGKEFLKEVENKEPNLRNHIKKHGDFINLIHRLRERVIHSKGLKEIGFFSGFGSKISSVILIDSNEGGMIRSCGDKTGPYRILSEWGVYNYVPDTNYFFANPYYFAKSATRLLLHFADEYLKLAGHTKFSFAEIKEFEQYSLRGVEQ
jgi:hypothetical protein